jgi:hypothetical protein
VTDAGPPTATRRAPPAPFWRTVRRALGESYDYLGTILAASALLTLLGLAAALLLAAALVALWSPRAGRGGPADWLPLLLAGTLSATLLGPLLAGLARLVGEIVAREHPALGDLFREARWHARPGAVLAALQSWITLLLVVDLAFFAASPGPLRWLAVPIVYLLLFWCLMLAYQWPLYASGAGTPLVVVRKSALLVLDNLPFSLGVTLLSLLFTLLCAVTTLGLVLLWPGALAFFHTIATRALLRRYGLLPPEPDPSLEEGADSGRLAVRSNEQSE